VGNTKTNTKNKKMILETITLLAESKITGSLSLGLAGLGAGIGIGLVGLGASQATGRNPGAAGKILTISIVAMALAEAIAIYGLILAFGEAGQ
jgi:F-type H+-transporting ATPase subunit c|tara:strand:- start:96 stop:374 length:279 start_codon:yes stop_codon:yes gene_type:complete